MPTSIPGLPAAGGTPSIQSLVSLVQTSTLAKVILGLIILVILVIILIPVVRKIKRKQLKEKTARNITRDLMVWRHIAQMVKGGEDQNKAKNLLSDNIARINHLLDQGFELVSSYRRKLYENPWFLLLGEPRSGKSSLLSESSLELVPSAQETASAQDGTGSFPVRLWLGSKAVVYDVSGRVLFDRWLEGSSAEWNYIVQQIKRRRGRKPLDGIILTIPADALLADDDILSQKKAILMATELGQVFHSLGMYLPCYVVVTKLDMIDGFREYVEEIPEELRHQVLGFSNEDRLYKSAKFAAFRDSLLEKLREGCKKSMLSRAVIARVNNISNRMDISGKMYLFPENFSALFKNLDMYLNTLFGEDNFQGSRNIIFEGIYFSSALDQGVSLSKGIAALAGKTVDEFPLTAAKPPASRPYFVRDLLHKVIFNPSPNAAFTFRQQVLRYIPLYILCGILLFYGSLWIYAAKTGADSLKLTLIPLTDYYQTLNKALQGVSLSEAPLITWDEKGNFMISRDLPMPGNAQAALSSAGSRSRFFQELYLYTDREVSPPLGFKLSSLIYFGSMRDIGRRDRFYIFNQLYGVMVRDAVIKCVGKKLTDQEGLPVVLDDDLRAAIHSYLLLDEFSGKNYHRLITSKEFNIKAMLHYLMPDVADSSLYLYYNSFDPRYSGRGSYIIDTSYVDTDEHLIASYAAINIMLSAWERLITYPDSFYGRFKNLVLIAQQVGANYAKINSIASHINEAASIDDLVKRVTEWKSLLDTQTSLVNQGRAAFQELCKANILAAALKVLGPNIDVFSDDVISTYLFRTPVVSYAMSNYTGLFNADMAYIEKKIGTFGDNDAVKVISGRVSGLRGSFSRNLDADFERLLAVSRELSENSFMTMKVADSPPNAESLFNVAERIFTLADGLALIDGANLKREDFSANWQQCQSDIQRVSDAYEAYVKAYAENDRVKDVISGQRDMLLAEATINRYAIMESGINVILTSTETQIAEYVRSASKPDDNIFAFSNPAMSTLLGPLVYDRSYDPTVVKGIIEQLIYFAELFTKYTNPEIQKTSRYYTEMEAFRSYLGTFINYWGTYPDSAYPPLSTWDAYRERLKNYQSYQVNSVLQSLYQKSIDILKGIPDAMLDDNMVKTRDTLATSLNDRVSLLSMFFNDNTQKMLSAWSRLPADPEDAFQTLQAETPQGLKDAYMTAYSDAKEFSVGWWNSFTMNGFNILSDTYYQKRLEEFLADLDTYESYPLCTDAPISGAMSLSDMEKLAYLLAEMGAAPQPAAQAQPQSQGQGQAQPQAQTQAQTQDPVSALFHKNLFRGIRAKNWSETIYKITAGVADKLKPLVWTIYQPPVDVQSKLLAPGKFPATNRFRYVEAATGPSSQRFLTYAKDETALVQGNITGQGFTLKFYVMSSDSAPAVTVNFNDPWSIFGLYFSANAVSGEDGQRYIPVPVEDKSGTYIYYIRVGFNNDLPRPDQWYSKSTWPEIKVVDSGVEAGRPVVLPDE